MNIFISQPMNGKSIEEIRARQQEIKQILQSYFPNEEIKIIESIVTDTDKSPVWCLGYSVMRMDKADLVVFDKGWRQARGCKVEYDVCSYYGFKFMEL